MVPSPWITRSIVSEKVFLNPGFSAVPSPTHHALILGYAVSVTHLYPVFSIPLMPSTVHAATFFTAGHAFSLIKGQACSVQRGLINPLKSACGTPALHNNPPTIRAFQILNLLFTPPSNALPYTLERTSWIPDTALSRTSAIPSFIFNFWRNNLVFASDLS